MWLGSDLLMMVVMTVRGRMGRGGDQDGEGVREGVRMGLNVATLARILRTNFSPRLVRMPELLLDTSRPWCPAGPGDTTFSDWH